MTCIVCIAYPMTEFEQSSQPWLLLLLPGQSFCPLGVKGPEMDVHPANGWILSMPPGIPKEFEQGEIEDKPKDPKGKDSPKKVNLI